MQAFDTKHTDSNPDEPDHQIIIIGRVEDLPQESCKTLELANGDQIAVFNVDGEFCAISNFCPHKGAPLAEGTLCGNVIECEWHGWQFDVRTGECLTVMEKIPTYRVAVEGGMVKVVL